jgi:hypothetical protein
MQYAYLYFDLIMKREISTILKYKFGHACVVRLRSMVRLQCHAEC